MYTETWGGGGGSVDLGILSLMPWKTRFLSPFQTCSPPCCSEAAAFCKPGGAGERAGDRRVGTFLSVSSHSLSICEARPSAAAVFEFTILRDGKLGGVGGGDAISDLHAVPFLHLGQRTHQSGVGRIQRHDPFFLQHTKRGFIMAPCGQLAVMLYQMTVLINAFYQTAVHMMLPRQMERLCLFLHPSQASFPWAQWVCVSFSPSALQGLLLITPWDPKTSHKNDTMCYSDYETEVSSCFAVVSALGQNLNTGIRWQRKKHQRFHFTEEKCMWSMGSQPPKGHTGHMWKDFTWCSKLKQYMAAVYSHRQSEDATARGGGAAKS